VQRTLSGIQQKKKGFKTKENRPQSTYAREGSAIAEGDGKGKGKTEIGNGSEGGYVQVQ